MVGYGYLMVAVMALTVAVHTQGESTTFYDQCCSLDASVQPYILALTMLCLDHTYKLGTIRIRKLLKNYVSEFKTKRVNEEKK